MLGGSALRAASDAIPGWAAIEKRVGDHGIAEPQRREQHFAECAGVDEAPACIETLQTRQRRRTVTQLGVVVIFNDPGPIARGEIDERQPSRERQRHAGWKLS